MKKMFLLFILMIGVLNAKDIMICKGSYVGNLYKCYTEKETLDFSTIYKMYALNWRLIQVIPSTSSGDVFYYLEK